ncbi:pyridoxal phosphate-dependent aminotransferase [Mesoterricola sediminis]|uniref:Aminotransferase n=1 Tax=Mesoterricola sediminis TaxID=2927980 RepID=A0AA48KCY2_9BACT|nr:pyridoxal phosphate-dependent aminotransferase [Mesoterricola sediminis]BDU75787.1 aspartate aminotransferase [Mesoterricola sediminis]
MSGTGAGPAPADRLSHLRPSPIRAIAEGAPADAVPMGLGEPGWDLPAPAAEALASVAGPCAYGPNAGLPELQEAVGAFHGEPAARVLLACGSQGALFALVQAWAGPGDEVLVPDPGFLAYPALARMAGAVPVPYALAPDFSLDPGAFAEALDRAPRARLALVNHPGNPTGAGASREALAAVAAACEARGVLLVSDEVYRDLHLGPRAPGLRDVTAGGVVLGSVSKAWGAPGLRVGWALGAPELLAPARLVHAYMVTAPARTSQLAALALLRASGAVLAEARAHLQVRWEAFSGAWAEAFGAAPAPGAGGFYHWQPLPPGADPMAFCLRLRDEGRVIVVPGHAFGERGRGHVRISYAGDPGRIREGVARLAPFWRTA